MNRTESFRISGLMWDEARLRKEIQRGKKLAKFSFLTFSKRKEIKLRNAVLTLTSSSQSWRKVEAKIGSRDDKILAECKSSSSFKVFNTLKVASFLMFAL